MSVRSKKTGYKSKQESVELEEVIGLSAEKLHALLMQCGWRLMDAYAITGRELYFKQAEALRNIYSRMDNHLRLDASSSAINQMTLTEEE